MTNPAQLAYLEAMGIPVWVSRERVLDVPQEQLTAVATYVKEDAPCAESAGAILEAMDEATSKPSGKMETPAAAISNAPDKQLMPDTITDCSSMDWQTLEQAVATCRLCDLHKTRIRTVFGGGNQQADWMIVGEAPGAEEDRQGLPFVGRAGQLLTNMLAAIKLKREDAYIANVLKCRPPNNRDPLPQEVAACRGYLQRQFELVQPRIILVVGRVAAQSLLQTKEPLARLRGRVHSLPGSAIPVVVTYHPAYLLRKPADKGKAWQDLKLAYRVFQDA